MNRTTAGWIAALNLCLILLSNSACVQKSAHFRHLNPASTGIDFSNIITESDSVNIIDLENVYNGGGVAAGDFNNDGLQDLYFTGNLVRSRMYLNQGKLKFRDITREAGVEGQGRWCRGVATVDINNDGWLDLYVCATLMHSAATRTNLLYVNQGADASGLPVFKEMAAAYGLADTSHSTMAAFFDYDNDGDLDCYIAVNDIVAGDHPNRFRPILSDGSHASTDRLYRNEGSDSLGHPFFVNVSKAAGITWEGYSHAVSIADINRDGWKDIYVSNDYISGNLLYLNNRDGTFTNRVQDYFKHGSANAMGNDIIDINNDGLSDLIELDMSPEDNVRKKMMLNPNSYQTYQNIDYFGYPYQYVRNTLQLNLGERPGASDSMRHPIFGDISFFSGLAETDWSWTPSVADFDNDGDRDIVISNGFPKDITDHDFIAYRNEAFMITSKNDMLAQIPEVKIRNYVFSNNGDLTFSDVTTDWGMQESSFSNGAIYVDLDNDGDLDYVANNINDPAFVYENKLNEPGRIRGHFLQLALRGDSGNRNGIGARVEIFGGDSVYQAIEVTPYRGYLSSVDMRVHFGIGMQNGVDSLVVTWPDNRRQMIRKPEINQLLTIDRKDALPGKGPAVLNTTLETVFQELQDSSVISYRHQEKDFVDFNIQRLLPHKMSQYGPAMAVGDVNGDGLDDLVIGGSKANATQVMIQGPGGRFQPQKIQGFESEMRKFMEDMGLLLFDADLDGDLDLYVASGSYENLPMSPDHRDCFYYNDGRGHFTPDTSAIPLNYTSKSCVRAADFDSDGDLDLFIGGRVQPGAYPKPVSSFLYRNDLKGGKLQFTDVTAELAPDLVRAGLVCDALWSDFDNDGQIDLVLAGEWMPVTFLRNENSKFRNVSTTSGISDKTGWWNSIAGADLDDDGDIDYVVGNLGLNSFYKGSVEHPVSVYAKDFDNNGSYDAIPALYLPQKPGGQRRLYPAQTRDDLVKQMIGFRQKFPSYKPFAEATMDKLLTPEEQKDMLVLNANAFASVVLINLGEGRFTTKPLPPEAQWAPINGIVVNDFDMDGHQDIVATQNDFGTEVAVGRYDAGNGLMLRGDGTGAFKALPAAKSGFFLPGDGKALVWLADADDQLFLAASQNMGPLKLFKSRGSQKILRTERDDLSITMNLSNGKQRKVELYKGSGFLSQSAAFVVIPPNVRSLEIRSTGNKKRNVQIP